MNRNHIKIKKVTGLLIAFILLVIVVPTNSAFAENKMIEAPLNPEFAEYMERINDPKFKASGINPYGKGLIPEPIKMESNLDSIPERVKNAILPSKYDLRDYNKLTPVKNQGTNGSCWAFATYSSLESWLMPFGEWDFSENHMKNTHGFDHGHDAGGNITMSTAYLTRWDGPVLEKDDPFNENSDVSPEGLPIAKKVKNVLYIPDRLDSLDNDYIKWAIMEYGAVQTSYYDHDSNFNREHNSYYYNGENVTNHAVAIVGWDDNYSKENFNDIPNGDGAFIIKNSWGEDWGEDGYFYASYYDTKIGTRNAVYINAVDPNDYNNVYQYDPLGKTGAVGFGGKKTNWFANVFDSKGDEEELVAAAFYTNYENMKYEIFIDLDFTDGDFSKLKKVKEGTIELQGYHTIDFDPETIEAGKKFVVAVKATLTGDGDLHPIPLERRISGYTSEASANLGESYYSVDGQSWYDLTTYEQEGKYPFENTNVNLKAFTKDPFIAVEGINLNHTSITLDKGDTETLIASIVPENASNKDVLWTTEDESIAMVNENGEVIGIKGGRTNIVVTTVDGGYSAVCQVEVIELEYTGEIGDIKINEEDIEINISKSTEDLEGVLIVQYYDENNRPLRIQYKNIEKSISNYRFALKDMGKPVKSVRVFLWDSLENMKPLSNSARKEI